MIFFVGVSDAIDKKIADNPFIALKTLITSQEEEKERQEIQLMFGQSTYCHHRAVREIWRNLEDSIKRESLLCVRPRYIRYSAHLSASMSLSWPRTNLRNLSSVEGLIEVPILFKHPFWPFVKSSVTFLRV